VTCPRGCGIHLAITERMGIEIDYCPQCRGIWLDRGELEKLIAKFREEEALLERAAQPNPVPMPEPRPQAQPQAPYTPPPAQPQHDPRYQQPYNQGGPYDNRGRRTTTGAATTRTTMTTSTTAMNTATCESGLGSNG